jgi:hypothetical protein
LKWTVRRNVGSFVHPHACAPTGVAIGAPLSRALASELADLSNRIEREVRRLSKTTEPVFARVPQRLLHVTVVNRSHFEATKIELLTAREHAVISRLIDSSPPGPITLEFRELLMTPTGRVLLAGYVRSGDLVALRQKIVSAIPSLATQLPRTAHIKLGHLLVPMPRRDLHRLRAWMNKVSLGAHSTVAFRELYTPRGRIRLSANSMRSSR